MSVVGLSIEVTVGTDAGPATQRIVAAFERAGDELRGLMQYAGPRLVPVFESGLERQFDAEGHGPYAGHWAALSKRYAEWKAEKYPGRPILERTGDLRTALTQSSSPLASREWSASEFAFGTVGLEYAAFHQLGTAFMPARPPFDFDSQFEDAFTQAAHLAVVDAVKAARVSDFAQVTP